uniref:F-box domain-containing protein n=1 Tax=Physcomitrium patens TaxID=3218 RepID=A0A7I4EKE3_PHYPA
MNSIPKLEPRPCSFAQGTFHDVQGRSLPCRTASRFQPHAKSAHNSTELEEEDSTASESSVKTSRGKFNGEAVDSVPGRCNSQVAETSGFIDDIMKLILAKLECKALFQARAQSKKFKALIDSDDFHRLRGELRPQEAELTALHFSVRDDVWQCHGHDLITNTWSKLPPFKMLPPLDVDLFKAHSICGAAGVMCANVGTDSDKLILFNPLTGGHRELCRLNHPRIPVLMHMIVNSEDNSYKIIVAGSSRLSDDKVSRITEVLDSRTSKWKVTGDIPGPVFALNDYQTGVYRGGLLYCIAFLPAGGKGVIVYDVEKEKWVPDRNYALPYSLTSNTVQLVENSGRIYLFSELEHLDNEPDPLQAHDVEHRIDELLVNEDHTCTSSERRWRQVISTRKKGNMGLQTHPEHTCVPFGKDKLCVFNRIKHSGIVYDVESGEKCESSLPSPSRSRCGTLPFYSLNPLTFDFKPSFKGGVSLQACVLM